MVIKYNKTLCATLESFINDETDFRSIVSLYIKMKIRKLKTITERSNIVQKRKEVKKRINCYKKS